MNQWAYQFQVDGHLMSIVIESTYKDSEMYDLKIDGRSFMDLKLTTLTDLRASSREDVENASVWARGGAVAGVASDAPSMGAPSGGGRAHRRDDTVPAVAAVSMAEFVGGGSEEHAGSGTGAGASWDDFDAEPKAKPVAAPVRRAAPAPAAAAAAELDPFAGSGADDPAPVPAPAPAPAATRPHLAGPSRAAALAPPHAAAAAAPQAARARVPTPVEDDLTGLAGLNFGGSYSVSASSNANAHSSQPAVVDIFSQPLPSITPPVAASAAAGASTTPNAAASDDPFGAGGLYDLDHLTAPPKAHAGAAAARPTLGQLVGAKSAAGPAPGAASAGGQGGGLGNLDALFGSAGGGGIGGGAPMAGGLGSSNAGAISTLGIGGGPIYGGGMMAPPPQQQQQQQQQHFFGAPAPAPQADYNPFA